MSEEKKNEADLTVNVQDIDNIEKFMDHFKFARTKEYVAAIEAFRKSPGDLTLSREAIYQLAKNVAACKGQNELVDEIFADVLPACLNISYNMQFDKDLEEIIGVDPTATQPD